ncbi:MAG: GxxExxY protein [Vicinamibacterales bacterium]
MLHDDVTGSVLACAVTVHRALGPGLREHSYQRAMELEMRARGIAFSREPSLEIRYRGVLVGAHRPDFIVADQVVLEIKAVHGLDAVFRAQVVTYLRVSGLPVGLLVNFNVAVLKDGIRRFVL